MLASFLWSSVPLEFFFERDILEPGGVRGLKCSLTLVSASEIADDEEEGTAEEKVSVGELSTSSVVDAEDNDILYR